MMLRSSIPHAVACPDGKGFEARFEEFKITYLPDLRRLEWLKKNQ